MGATQGCGGDCGGLAKHLDLAIYLLNREETELGAKALRQILLLLLELVRRRNLVVDVALLLRHTCHTNRKEGKRTDRRRVGQTVKWLRPHEREPAHGDNADGATAATAHPEATPGDAACVALNRRTQQDCARLRIPRQTLDPNPITIQRMTPPPTNHA
jgi:hypothetical protein